MNKFKVALIQLDSRENVEENLNSIKALVNEASQNADLVILPEHSDGIGESDEPFAHSIPGKISNFFSDLAKENNVYLHCGSVAEKGVEGKPYNTSILFNPAGEIVAKYSKLHLFDVDLPDGTGCRESSTATAGNEIVVANTELCNIGLSICYDVRFPELYRSMALMGADVMVVSANFTKPTGMAHWETLLRARAIENGCYVLAVNQFGTKALFEAYGHTMIINPWGEIEGELQDKVGILYGEIDLDKVAETRSKIPSLLNRRKDLYLL